MVTPTTNEVAIISLEAHRASDGRLDGRARREGTAEWHSFSGVLELLKVLEVLCTAGTAPSIIENIKETGK
jgi:hypothetical protein